MRLVILGCFAAIGKAGFGQTLAQLLAIASCYCVVAGGWKREEPLAPVFTHYDEAAAYGVLATLVWRFL